MKPMTNKELNEALADPWAWCLLEIHRRHLSSAHLSTVTNVNRSTMRALYNGRSAGPGYDVLVKIVQYLMDTRSQAPMPAPDNRNSGLLPGMKREELPLKMKKVAA